MSEFQGFYPETLKFFKDLESNNSNDWFNEHKGEYEKFVREPARGFVIDMGEMLTLLDDGIQAIPKVNKSLFRINRDTRFSKNKLPYKTNMGLWFWSGERKRMECPGFYFHLEKGRLMLGTGLYMFTKELMELYRDAVVSDRFGKSFRVMIEKMESSGFSIGRKHYKKTPRGYDREHENAEYLLYNGLYAGVETAIPEEFYRAEIVDYCFRVYRDMLPMHEWLLEVLGDV